MNFGTYEIEQVIWKQIRMGVTVQCKGGTKKFVKDLAKKIYEYADGNMNNEMRIIAATRGIPAEIVDYAERFRKAFSFSQPILTDNAGEVYQWLIEQEKNGQTIEKFVEWARNPERVQFINKYKKDVGGVRNDWALAFTMAESKFTKNQDGSLYV